MTGQPIILGRIQNSGGIFFRAGGGFLEKEFLDALPADPAHRDGEAGDFQSRANLRQISEPVKNVTADRVDAVGHQLKPEMLGQIVEPRVAAHDQTPVLERLDVKLGVAQRCGVADDLLDDVGQRDDPLRPAKLIDHNRKSLRVREKTSQQVHRSHRLRDERRRHEHLGVMLRGIEEELFHVDDPNDLIGRVGVNRHAAVAPLPEERNRLFVRQIIRHRKGIDSRRHAILRRLVAELDDFLNHLALRLLQSPLRLAHLDQRLEFFVRDPWPHAQFLRREPIDDHAAGALEPEPDPIEQRQEGLEGEDTDRRDSIGGRDREQLGNQIAKQDDDRKNRERRDPRGQLGDERTLPNKDQTKDDERHIDERVAEQEDVEDAARILAECAQEISE